MSLKRKKMIESQLEQVENNLQRILEQQMMLEDQRLNMEALLAQQYAAKASKSSMKVRMQSGGSQQLLRLLLLLFLIWLAVDGPLRCLHIACTRVHCLVPVDADLLLAGLWQLHFRAWARGLKI